MKCGRGSRFEKGVDGVRRFWLVYPLPAVELADLDMALASFVPADVPPRAEEVWRAITRGTGAACAIVIHLQGERPHGAVNAAGLS